MASAVSIGSVTRGAAIGKLYRLGGVDVWCYHAKISIHSSDIYDVAVAIQCCSCVLSNFM